MSNSALVSYTQLSPNNSGVRTQPISRFTPHCYCAQVTVERMGKGFANPDNKTSANYGIGYDGAVGLYVPENKRAWTSSSEHNDQRAITVECASDGANPFKFNTVVYNRLIELCVDICKRNGKSRVIWIPNKDTALAYAPKTDEMLITVHRWFSSSRSCPGDWLFNRLGEFAVEVNNQLGAQALYRVQVGAFRNIDYANAYCKQIRQAGFPAFVTRVE